MIVIEAAALIAAVLLIGALAWGTVSRAYFTWKRRRHRRARRGYVVYPGRRQR